MAVGHCDAQAPSRKRFQGACANTEAGVERFCLTCILRDQELAEMSYNLSYGHTHSYIFMKRDDPESALNDFKKSLVFS